MSKNFLSFLIIICNLLASLTSTLIPIVKVSLHSLPQYKHCTSMTCFKFTFWQVTHTLGISYQDSLLLIYDYMLLHPCRNFVIGLVVTVLDIQKQLTVVKTIYELCIDHPSRIICFGRYPTFFPSFVYIK